MLRLSINKDLASAIRILVKNIKFILVFCFFSSLIAIFYYFNSQTIYKIESIIEIGSVGGEQIEKPILLIDKLKTTKYLTEINNSSCLSRDETNLNKFLSERLFIKIGKNTNYLSFIVVSDNFDRGISCLNSIFLSIKNNQSIFFENKSKFIRDNISIISNDLVKISNITNQLGKIIIQNGNIPVSADDVKSYLELDRFIVQLKLKLVEYESQLNIISTKETNFILSPTLKSVGKDQTTIIITFLILVSGFLFSLVILFLKKFIISSI